MSRCINHEDLMEDDFFKDIMVEILRIALKKYDFEYNDFTIVDNHFHIIITTHNEEHSISRIMQFIKSRFAQHYNKIMNRSGPFWNERFYSTVVEHSDDPEFYFDTLIVYIAYNAVRKGKVSDPRKYKYCGSGVYFIEGFEPIVEITLHKYYLRLGTNFRERLEKLLIIEDRYRRRINLFF